MKSTMLLLLALFLSGVAAGQGKDDRQLLMETDQAWSQAAAEGKDVEKVVAYWTDDAVIVPSGAPIISGKAAIRDYVKQSFETPGFKISWKTLDASVSSDGSMGYTTAESSFTFQGPDGKLQTQTGRGVAIWRRNSDGQWKCVYDTWNHGP
ncbi:YybH family protein [Luteimonas sp. 22616]|uniref:YybH family protein n=1 Tax=Luteimonas sp. 22616 TaxID=3453951 RepID=UPI003F856C57